MRFSGRRMLSKGKESEQVVCPFLEYVEASGPGVYHIEGLWCTGVSFHRKVTEKHAINFCLNENYIECLTVKLIPTERKTSIKEQPWSLKKLQKAKKWLSKHQRED